MRFSGFFTLSAFSPLLATSCRTFPIDIRQIRLALAQLCLYSVALWRKVEKIVDLWELKDSIPTYNFH
jgi:hypothetical protein